MLALSRSMNLGARRGTAPVAAHLVRRYLGGSETFIYTLLRFQERYRPVVLAGNVLNVHRFPLDDVRALTPDAAVHERVTRRMRALAAGFPTTYDHRLSVELRSAGTSIAHAHFGWTGAAALEACRRAGVPLVVTFYGRDVNDPAAPSYTRLFESASFIFCEGPYMAAHLERVGCPSDRIRVLKIGLDPEQFQFFGCPSRRPRVLIQVARFVEKKGIDVSIRALALVRETLRDAELWLVGDGPLRRDIEQLTRQLNLAGAVRFFGAVSHARYRDMLRSVDVCVQPSRTSSDGDTEGGAPTVLLEMQASGIPVVSTRHADIPSIVPFADALVDEDDAEGIADRILTLAAATPEERLQRAHVAREYVMTEHDAGRIGRVLESYYDEARRR